MIYTWVGLEDSHQLITLAESIAALTSQGWARELSGDNPSPAKTSIKKPQEWEGEFRGNNPSPAQNSLNRMELITTLGKLTSSEFNMLVFSLEVPANIIPSSTASQGESCICPATMGSRTYRLWFAKSCSRS